MFNEGPADPILVNACTCLNVGLVEFPSYGLKVLATKIKILELAPYDETFFLDADILVVGEIDDYFDMLSGRDFVFTNFAGWKSDGNIIGNRMRKWSADFTEEQIKKALAFGPAINVGTFAFRKGHSFLQRWADLTKIGTEQKLFIPDEVIAQIMLPELNCHVAGPEWGVSVKFGRDMPNNRIIHYHGRKHAQADLPLCQLWKDMYWSIRSLYGINGYYGDKKVRRLHKWMSQLGASAEAPSPVSPAVTEAPEALDLRATLVIAVNEKYLNKLKANYPTWSNFATRYPVLVIYNGVNLEQLSFIKGQVRFVEWNMDVETDRERMLSSFVLCAPFNVDTPFWIKLDVDVMAKRNDCTLFSSKQWYDYDLVGHRWGYTKPGKWIKMLEEWADAHPAFANAKRLFTDEQLVEVEQQKRYGHKRIASFVCLHNTEFTRMAAKLAGDRLPVPSHDTYLWYVATRLGYKIKRTNIKKWGLKP